MPIQSDNHKKYLATGLLLLLGLILLYFLRIFFLSLFGAYVFSFLFSPVYLWINRRLDRDRLAAVLTIVLILVVAFIPLLLITYTAFNQALTLQDKFDPAAFSSLLEHFNPSIRAGADRILEKVTRDFANTLTDALPSIFSAVSRLSVSLFIMFFVMYYIFLNIHYVIIRSTEYLPFSQKNAIWLVREFEHISKAILLGQVLLSVLQGLVGGIGFLVFGLPDAALWGIVMAVLSIVPVVGTALVWLPAGLYMILEEDYVAGIGLLLWGGILVSQIDNWVRPLLGKKLANINPIVMLLGAFAGLEILGIVGVVLGPFLLAFFFLLLQVYRQEYLGHPAPESGVEILTQSDGA